MPDRKNLEAFRPQAVTSAMALTTSSSEEPKAEGVGAAPARNLDALGQKIHRQLVDKLTQHELKKLPELQQKNEVRALIEELLDKDNTLLSFLERKNLIDDLMDEIFGLGPLEKLLKDPTVNDILVNGPEQVYVERRGRLEETALRFRDNQHLLDIIVRIVARVGRRIDEANPMVDARLADGSRVNAVIPPLALRGPTLSIRRFGVRPLAMNDLLEYHSLAPEMALLLQAAVRARASIVVSGGTGSGKTTLLNVLSSFINPEERIITIEDSAELQLQQRHVVQLESRLANVEGRGAVTIRDLLRNALRMRPDRIVVGECRGPEVVDMLQAMNTGHEGSMTTLHANGPRDALYRIETMYMMAGYEIPLKAMRQQMVSALRLIVQIDRLQGGPRRITSITEVTGLEGDVIVQQELFRFRQTSLDLTGKVQGQFEATGVRPTFLHRARLAGMELPPALFTERVLAMA
jgi:pilus assembly protein CpaF